MAQKRLKILITAGPTREYIDTVRYISNESSGRMGACLADAAFRRGHRVTLIHGILSIPLPNKVRRIPIVSAADMLAACQAHYPRNDVLIMAAAVADYRPSDRSAHKLKKSATTMTLHLEPTPDVLATIAGDRREDQIAIGFALEDRHAQKNAEKKLRNKHLDAIVLNAPNAIAADKSESRILVRGREWMPAKRQSKAALAKQIIRLVETISG